jgi:hypothetical protein
MAREGTVMAVRDIIRPVPGVRHLSIARQRLRFGGSGNFWERRYADGGTSGGGSYGRLAEAKASFLNAFVAAREVDSVIEFGCGDGNQLSLAKYPSYIGLDVAPTAIGLCQERFASDRSKSFFRYDGSCFTDHAGLFAADLAVSLDVVYHLVEDEVFDTYMSHLFAAARRFVILYSTNILLSGTGPHVRHREFTLWIKEKRAEWRLSEVVEGPATGVARADFYVYELETADNSL